MARTAGDLFRVPNLIGDLLGGVHDAHATRTVQLRLVVIEDGAIGTVSFSEDPPYGGRRY
ncbi:hypothetical protein NJB1507_16110 [Mycobacterium marinum]|nr:hypothetical protein NJB1507_16110 [Mycobacterium marinum]